MNPATVTQVSPPMVRLHGSSTDSEVWKVNPHISLTVGAEVLTVTHGGLIVVCPIVAP